MKINVAILLVVCALVGSISICHAQKVILVLKDSTKKEVSITASSDKAIFTDKGQIKFNQIAIAQFEVNRKRDESLVTNMQLNGVTITYKTIDSTVPITTVAPLVVASSPIVVDKAEEPITLNQVVDGLEKFRKQRTTGKVFQLVGVLATGASIFMANQKEPDIDMVKGLAIGGLAVGGIGIVIDISAGNHIKFKR